MSPEVYTILGFILFTIGAIGVIFRRNAVFVLMNLELMMNAVGLVLVAASLRGLLEGQVIVLMLLAVAAADVSIGIAIVINLVRYTDKPDIDSLTVLQGRMERE